MGLILSCVDLIKSSFVRTRQRVDSEVRPEDFPIDHIITESKLRKRVNSLSSIFPVSEDDDSEIIDILKSDKF